MGVLDLVRTGEVARLTLRRPDALNTLTPELARTLEETLGALRADRSVRALVLTGEGRAFCAGADLKSLLPHLGPDGLDEVGTEAVRTLHRCALALQTLPIPVVAAVQGACAGGGLGLALGADITWAATSATFVAAFGGIGLSPDTGTSRLLPRAVGSRVARELLLTNRRIDAAEALQLGLVTRVLPDGALLEACHELAVGLARTSMPAVAATKALLDAQSTRTAAEQLDAEVEAVLGCLAGADFGEGVRAFVDKRAPSFTAPGID